MLISYTNSQYIFKINVWITVAFLLIGIHVMFKSVPKYIPSYFVNVLIDFRFTYNIVFFP